MMIREMTVDFGKMEIHHLYKITDVTFLSPIRDPLYAAH